MDEAKRDRLTQFLIKAIEEYGSLDSSQVQVEVMEEFQFTNKQFNQLVQFANRNRGFEEQDESDNEGEEDDKEEEDDADDSLDEID